MWSNKNNSNVNNIPEENVEKPHDKISNMSAMMHMIKSTIGGGFLAMPEAFRYAGLVVGTIGTMVLGAAVLNMMSFIVRVSQILRSGKYSAKILADQKESNGGTEDNPDGEPIDINSNELVLEPMDYPETVGAVFKYGSGGRFASWSPLARRLTTWSLIFTYYGVNIIYVCIVASTTKQLVDNYTENTWAHGLYGLSIRWYPLCVALLIIPMGMIQLIKYLVPFSVIANTLMSAGTVVLFYFIFTDDDGRDPLKPEEQSKLVVWPITQWTLFAGSALCSMEGVGMLMHIENSMKKPRELAGPPAYTLHWSMLIIVILNGTLGFFGYIRYGERCLGSVPLNLPSDNWLSEAVKIAVTCGILMTYGLQLTVTADLAWQMIKGRSEKKVFRRIGSKEQEKSETNKHYYLMRFGLIVGTVIVATVVPNIGPMISLVGSVGFSVLGLMIPAVLETVWYWDPKSEDDYEEIMGNLNCDGETVEDGIGLASAMALTPKDKNSKKARQKFTNRRKLRHIKNTIYWILGMSALVGGAYYNTLEILHPAKP